MGQGSHKKHERQISRMLTPHTGMENNITNECNHLIFLAGPFSVLLLKGVWIDTCVCVGGITKTHTLLIQYITITINSITPITH